MNGARWLRALRPSDAPWAVAPALRALGAAGAIAVLGAAFGDLNSLGVAYFGAACSVSFVTNGVYRARLAALAAQGAGAVLGLTLGSLLPHSTVSLVVTAAAIAALSGLVGTIGWASTAFALMLVIGLAFGQFSGSPLAWWQLSAWYLAGSAIVLVATITPWLRDPKGPERRAVAAVFDRAADLASAIGTPDAPTARRQLAQASAVSRSALYAYRFLRGTTRRSGILLHQQLTSSRLAAVAVAALHAEGTQPPPTTITVLRRRAAETRAGRPFPPLDARAFPTGPATPALQSLHSALEERPEPAQRVPALPGPGERVGQALRDATGPAAWRAAGRLALCMGIATLTTALLHDPDHSYWLPLTVAVIVRPEYASVFVRTVNRLAGTLVGAMIAAVVLAVAPSGWLLAIAAAVSLGLAVVAAPKLYGLSVVGITASALLSASIGSPDAVYPLVRMADTVLGCAIALVFGYLLWPGSRRLPADVDLGAGVEAAIRYLRAAGQPAGNLVALRRAQDEAYRKAHRARAAVENALLEPAPVCILAAARESAAAALDGIVDDITALAAALAREPAGTGGLAQGSIRRAEDALRGLVDDAQATCTTDSAEALDARTADPGPPSAASRLIDRISAAAGTASGTRPHAE